MIVSINQPAYLPWLGYFHRIAASDLHIVLDHVQFEKNSFTNRNRVMCGQAPCWLTVPVLSTGRFGALAIRDVEIDPNQDWRRKHLRTISQQYRKAAFFPAHESFLRDAYERSWTHLAEVAQYLTSYLFDQFNIHTPIQLSSELRPTATKSDLVLELCQKVGATTYLSGAMGRDYLQEQDFHAAGINVIYQEYHHPVYARGGGSFYPNLAAIDLLFHCGPGSRDILTSGQDCPAR